MTSRPKTRPLHETVADVVIGGTALAADRMREEAEKLRDDAHEIAERVEERAREARRDVRGAVHDAIHDTREAVSPGADASRPYEERTKDELYQLARERELPGRSAMSKLELIRALRAQR